MTLGDPAARSLDRSLLTGIAWTGGIKWTLQLLSWGSTLIVARILKAADFGLFGMATLYLGLVEMVNEFGIGTAIVQRRDLEEDQVAALGGFSVLLGASFATLSVALAVPIAGFFGEPAVQPLIQLSSLSFLAGGLQVLPRALLAKELRFRALATLDLIEGVVLTGTTLGCAFLGLSYWSLAIGSLAARLTGAVAANLVRPHRYALPRPFARVRETVVFGWHLVVGRLAWYAYSNADFAIIGRVLGKGPLGLYSIGWQLANIPVDRISAFIGRVTPAIFSAVQHDNVALRRYLRGLTEGLSVITFPAAVGLALVAEDLIPLALGPGWEGAVLPLQLLSAYAIFRSVNTLFPQMLVAKGLTRRAMTFNLVAVVIMPVCFLLGAHWGGTAGVAVGWIVGYPLVAVPLFMRDTFRAIGMSWSEWAGAVWPAASASLAMTAAVLALRFGVTASWGHAPRMMLHVAAGAAAYAGILWLMHRDRLRAALRMLREAKGGQ